MRHNARQSYNNRELRHQTFTIHGGQPEVRSCAFFIRHVFHGGLQGTFPTRADSARPSEFQNIFAMETWPLAEHYQ